MCRPVESDDIFSCVDPDTQMLILQQGQRTQSFGRPTENVVRAIKAMIARMLCTRGTFGSVRQKNNRKRKQELPAAEGGSCPNPNEEMPNDINVTEPVLKINDFSLIVIKKFSANEKLRSSSFRPLPKPPMGVIFGEWKLNAFSLPVLRLVPSLNNHLPWVYMANPGTSQGNHVFGNILTRQSYLVANSDLQSCSGLLYSKDGWLLLHGIEMDVSSSVRSPKYPVLLLNPTTGARIDLPSLNSLGGFAALCMTTQGTPGVVTYVRSRGPSVSVHMVRPGCASWEEHTYVFKRSPFFDTINKMVVCDGSLYCFFIRYCLIFKLADLSWHLIRARNLEYDLLCYEPLVMEGKVVMVGHPECLIRSPSEFLRMEICGKKFGWVKIADNDEMLNGHIWFIHRLQSFCVKVVGCGQKICWFARRKVTEGRRVKGPAYELHCLNVTTQAHYRLTDDLVICSKHAWVDLGCSSVQGLLERGMTDEDVLPGF